MPESPRPLAAHCPRMTSGGGGGGAGGGVQMISAALEGLRFESIRSTGEGGGWTHASYAFAGIRGVMFFSVRAPNLLATRRGGGMRTMDK